MSEKDDTQASTLQCPPNDDQEAWKAYWKTQGQLWRTEPEIDVERQAFLTQRRTIEPDIKKGIYPFQGIKLSRADMEWLLATHESSGMRGPVDWKDESQRERKGLDLRGANLSQENLFGLPLARMRGGLPYEEWLLATEEQRNMAAVQLQGADLRRAQLQRANLWKAQLQGANLWKAQLQGGFVEAQLQGADLRRSDLESATLDLVTLSDEKYGSVRLADVRWGDVNLAVVDWEHVTQLGDEQKAHQKKDTEGETKDKRTRIDDYKEAVRANRQLAIVLREQGLNEVADHFAFRAQKLQRVVWRRQRKLLKYAFSCFLSVVAGYGYRPYRCLMIYFLAVIIFTLAHYIVGAVAGPPLTFLNALAVSVQSLHGRLFSFQSSDPQALLNTIEAFVGLFIEAIVVAVITQRILGK
jgi:hypothetical protein